MANVHFILHPKDSKKPKAYEKTAQPIYFCYRFGQNEKAIYPTGFKTLPKYWNPKEYRLRITTDNADKDKINNFLNELETVTESFITDLKISKKELTKTELKNFIHNYLHPPKINENSLMGFFEIFLNKAEIRVNPKTGQRISYKRIRGYFRTFELLKEYCNITAKEIDFKDINLDFYNDFIQFLQDKTTKRKNGEIVRLTVNTIGHKIQSLKAVINEATEKGINTNLFYKSQKFKAPSEDNESIYLSEAELDQLLNHDFSKKPSLERVRDLFLIGAYTGLRFSDFTRLNQDNIRENRIYIEQKKTTKPVIIPCHSVFILLWNKYNGKLPKYISNQKFNEYLKIVCEQSGINEPFHKGITKGGQRITTKYKKYELVSSHTARRSFATNQYLSGFPAISIMQITGHKTEKAFLRYIKVSPEDHARLLELHWNKQNRHLKVI
jgi:integrase